MSKSKNINILSLDDEELNKNIKSFIKKLKGINIFNEKFLDNFISVANLNKQHIADIINNMNTSTGVDDDDNIKQHSSPLLRKENLQYELNNMLLNNFKVEVSLINEDKKVVDIDNELLNILTQNNVSFTNNKFTILDGFDYNKVKQQCLDKCTTEDKVPSELSTMINNVIDSGTSYNNEKLISVFAPLFNGDSLEAKRYACKRWINSINVSTSNFIEGKNIIGSVNDTQTFTNIDSTKYKNYINKVNEILNNSSTDNLSTNIIKQNGPNIIQQSIPYSETQIRDGKEVTVPPDVFQITISYKLKGVDYIDIVKYMVVRESNKITSIKTRSILKNEIFNKSLYNGEILNKWLFGLDTLAVSKTGRLITKKIKGTVDTDKSREDQVYDIAEQLNNLIITACIDAINKSLGGDQINVGENGYQNIYEVVDKKESNDKELIDLYSKAYNKIEDLKNNIFDSGEAIDTLNKKLTSVRDNIDIIKGHSYIPSTEVTNLYKELCDTLLPGNKHYKKVYNVADEEILKKYIKKIYDAVIEDISEIASKNEDKKIFYKMLLSIPVNMNDIVENIFDKGIQFDGDNGKIITKKLDNVRPYLDKGYIDDYGRFNFLNTNIKVPKIHQNVNLQTLEKSLSNMILILSKQRPSGQIATPESLFSTTIDTNEYKYVIKNFIYLLYCDSFNYGNQIPLSLCSIASRADITAYSSINFNNTNATNDIGTKFLSNHGEKYFPDYQKESTIINIANTLFENASFINKSTFKFLK